METVCSLDLSKLSVPQLAQLLDAVTVRSTQAYLALRPELSLGGSKGVTR
ncbi:MAG: hypothetical protein H6Q89_5709 [Myxococcaceae bacterium]|nr:hypothetical protein [Myxococcaceae bacterium]